MGNNKAAAVSSMIFLLLVTVVGAQTADKSQQSGGSTGAQALCENVNFKETCQQSLANAKSDDPKDLIQHAFNFAVANIGDVLSKSDTISGAAKDPSTSEALAVCKEVLNKSIFDFNRSISTIQNFDFASMDAAIADLKTWLSATRTVQTTCVDAFEGSKGDAGKKMQELLKTAGELSTNAITMVDSISKIFKTLNLGGGSSGGGGGGSASGSATTGRSMLDETENPTARRLMQASPGGLTPNAVVAQDGSGQYKTIMEAINTVPKGNAKPYVIHIKAGVYKEYVEISNKLNFVALVGDGIGKTRITGNKNNVDGVKTYASSTVTINGEHCILRDMTIENTAGPQKGQAVALRISGDMNIVYSCEILAFQDTLYCHSYRQFYRDCIIGGTVDFIFGDGQAVYQNCKLVARAPMPSQGNMFTAQGRVIPNGEGAIVFQNCSLVGDPAYLAMKPMPKSYLGRPWKEYSRTIIMQSSIDGFIDPAGWTDMTGPSASLPLFYAEYQNRGPGSDTSKRVAWKGIQKITPDVAQSFTVDPYLRGDLWIKQTGIPYEPGMMKV